MHKEVQYKEIDFEKLEQWIITYNKYKQPKRKRQLLTLIVLTCKPIVNNIAYGLARRSSDPIEDIIQVANIGLLKAIKRYNPEYKNLKIYISYTIVGEVKHYLRDKTALVRPPREIIELAYRINKISIEKLEKEGELYTKEHIAKSLNIEDKKIRELSDVERRKIVSLDDVQFKNDDESRTYSDDLEDENIKDFSESIKAYQKILDNALLKLPRKLQEVIISIYFENKSQSDLATEMNTSQSSISRMQKKALEQLYKIIVNEKDDKQEKE